MLFQLVDKLCVLARCFDVVTFAELDELRALQRMKSGRIE